jgi:hypothetical protein
MLIRLTLRSRFTAISPPTGAQNLRLDLAIDLDLISIYLVSVRDLVACSVFER